MCLSRKWSNFDEIFDPQVICSIYYQLFPIIVFPPLLAAILNFWVKHKKCVYLGETEQDGVISTNFLNHRVSAETTGDFLQNNISAILAAILNFCVKRKNTFISETERDRAISTKFLTHRVFASSTGDLLQNRFPATFGGHLEFLHKMQKCIYIGNGARYSDFDEIFDPQSISRVYWRLFPKIILPPLLAAILNLRKTEKKHLSWKRSKIERFRQNF